MNARGLETVSWRGVNGFGVRHLVPLGCTVTLCQRRIPMSVHSWMVDRGCTTGPICSVCSDIVDDVTKKRLEVVP